MAPRSRILAFGSAAALVAVGGICAALVAGTTGQILTLVLMSAGFGGAVLLVFLEVGLSEDHERESEDGGRGSGEQELGSGEHGGRGEGRERPSEDRGRDGDEERPQRRRSTTRSNPRRGRLPRKGGRRPE
jgi:hypothetical protein